MDLSIIIVNWNGRELLPACIQSIYRHQASLQLQVFVVDNDSSDGSVAMLVSRFPEVQVVESGGNLGFARANNLAIGKAEAPLVLFLNPDTEVRAGALQGMVDALRQDPRLGAVGCLTRDGTGTVQELGVQRFPTPATELAKMLLFSNRTRRLLARWLPHHPPDRNGCVNKLYGACLMVRREVLDQVGGFDERFFMYCEDVDFCERIRQAGWLLYYLADAEILHYGGSSSSQVPGAFSVLLMCDSFARLMRKHQGWPAALGYRAAMLFGAPCRTALLLLWGLGCACGLSQGGSRWKALMRKQITILQWALGLRRASIPGKVPKPDSTAKDTVAGLSDGNAVERLRAKR